MNASKLARMGSGSASRSLFGGFSEWGKNSLYYATELKAVHSNFNTLADSVCVVDSNEKSVSSTLGHKLMNEHSFKDARVKQANMHFSELLESMIIGDWVNFGRIIENEALSLHGLMLSSNPSYVLLRPNSLEIINSVRNYREMSGKKLFFTIDAGPNIHLIYDQNDVDIRFFIDTNLKKYCDTIIHDKIGAGPRNERKL